MTATWPIVCKTLSEAKQNMMINFEGILYLFEERLQSFTESFLTQRLEQWPSGQGTGFEPTFARFKITVSTQAFLLPKLIE